MSRLDPSRELQDFLDAVEASRERSSETRPPERHRSAPPSEERLEEPKTSAERQPARNCFGDSPRMFYDGARGYWLRERETSALAEVGKFRVLAVEEFQAYLDCGHPQEMDDDIRNLVSQGLLREGTFGGPEGSSRKLLTLTKSGHRLLRANRLVAKDQALYDGFVHPRELNHDADLYKLYQKEAARIESHEGQIVRVVLDFEIRGNINRDLAKFGPAARPEIACRHGLEVVEGKILIPDLRIEYQSREGHMAHLDLELVTEHYGGRQVADKVKAGFSLYTPRGEADRLRRVLDVRELTAEILSL